MRPKPDRLQQLYQGGFDACVDTDVVLAAPKVGASKQRELAVELDGNGDHPKLRVFSEQGPRTRWRRFRSSPCRARVDDGLHFDHRHENFICRITGSITIEAHPRISQ